MKNQDICRILREIATLLELEGSNSFRIRAYERAAQIIEDLTQDLLALVQEGNLTTLPGIGNDLADKITELVTTGKLKFYEELKKKIPAGVVAMTEIPGLGPKTVKKIYETLHIENIPQLAQAARQGKLRILEGIREKTEENILRGIELLEKGSARTPLHFAFRLAEEFFEVLRPMEEVGAIEIAGSLRRRKDTVRDIDILVVSKKPLPVMARFTSCESVQNVLVKGETKSSVVTKENGMQVDLRVVEKSCFGSALLYFTGSKEFNIKIRQLALKYGLKMNEYGVFKKEKCVAGKTESAIFSLLHMAFIPPELREDRGEIEAALKNRLPKLVTLGNIKGDLHVHSRYSDGLASLTDIANAASALGYQYLGACDHSQGLKVAHGLSAREVYRKIEEIKKINTKSALRLLCGTEVDIDANGRLDYPDSLLKEFDLVIAAIHSGFKQSKRQLTKRIIAACKNKYVNVIAHPTGRLWGARAAYDIDLDEILKVARDYCVAMEINCYPSRLDLNDIHVMQAKKMGVKLSLGSDSHRLEHLTSIGLGISVARRGWLEKGDIINCMDINKLHKWLKKT
ncbi:MAG: DNA polymerase/3'-5' exonuclease PolX [Candidatus Omnitrophota bacterium]